MNYYFIYPSCIGKILLISDGEFLTSLKVNESLSKDIQENNNLDVFKKTIKWLDTYFSGQEPKEKLPLKLDGTSFQKEVWNLLLEIPYGKVITYGEIANQIALKRGINKMSSQAVGNAIHNNPIPIIVPCHRVVGKNNNLVGFGLGMDLKIKLLELEGFDLKEYYYYENQKKKYVIQ